MGRCYSEVKRFFARFTFLRWLYGLLYTEEQSYSQQEYAFIKKNTDIWKGVQATSSRCVIVRFTTNFPDSFWGAMKRAQALREKFGYKIIVVLAGSSKKDYNNYYIINSFSPDKIIFKDRILCSTSFYIKVFKETISKFIQIRRMGMMEFLEYEIENVKIGDLVYDTIIRGDKNIVTLSKIKWTHIKTFYRAVREVYFFKRLFSEYEAKEFVVPENAYLVGIGIREAIDTGIPVFLINSLYAYSCDREKMYRISGSLSFFYSKEDLKKLISHNSNLRDKIEAYMQQRFSGQVRDFACEYAFGNKIMLTASEILKFFGICNLYNNILIAPHCFTDAPHASKNYLFKDYYEWFIYVLDQTARQKEINVFVKFHPCQDGYGERDISEKMLDKYPNVHLIPDSWNTSAVLSCMDAVLTTQGTIALEAACLGIPSMVVCDSYYNGFDVVPVAYSFEEYNRFLWSLPVVHRTASEEDMEFAKCVLYFSQHKYRQTRIDFSSIPVLPGDDFAAKLQEQYTYILKLMDNRDNIFDQEYLSWLNG